MELRHLRYLVAIADAGTFVRAAELLRVAQPALTRQIHDLEEELDAELFASGARKATLTAAGEACVRLVRHVIQDTERAVARARLSNAGLAGTCVVLSGPLPLISGFVARLVARVKGRYPGIDLVIKEGNTIDQWNALADAKADIGLGMAPAKSYQMLASETQYVDSADIALLAANHPLASRETITLEELRGEQFLALDMPGTPVDVLYKDLFRELRRQKFEPRKAREFSGFESLIAHVRAGQGWTLMTRLAAALLAPLVGVPLTDFRVPFPIARSWRRADKRPVVQTVLAELRRLEQEERELGGAADGAHAADDPGEKAPDFVSARLELRHLRSYIEVAKHGSVGRAAEAIEITQPALSRQIKDLEYDVGAPLFERVSRGVELTPAGRGFVEDVEGILSIVDHLQTEVHRAKRGAAQRCVIGVVPHPHIERITADVVADLESRARRVRVGLRAVGTPFQEEALRKSEIDIAIGYAYPARVPTSPLFARVRLFDDELSFALLASTDPLAKATSLSLADLRDVPFIFAGRDTFPPVYDVIMHQFSAAGVHPRVDAEYEGVQTIWSITAQGLGWSLGLREHAGAPPPGLVAIPLRDFHLPWGVELVYRKDESRAAILCAIDASIASANRLFPSVSANEATLPSSNTSQAVIP